MNTPTIFLFAALVASGTADGQTTIDPAAKSAYGGNLGWMNFAGDGPNGAVVGQYVCSGHIHSANCGWIRLGSGTPADGIHYQNNSATDFGVNVTNYHYSGGVHQADLRGFAYGANIGWINFEATGGPRIDLATGKLRGYAWSANCGWLNLGELSGDVNVVTTTISAGPDTDADGIADAWEYAHAEPDDLTALGDAPAADADGDGVTDRAEYLADTDPFSAGSRLTITVIQPGVPAGDFDLTFTSSLTRVYQAQTSPDLDAAFSNTGGIIQPTAATTTATVTEPGGDGRQFWRVVPALPLQP